MSDPTEVPASESPANPDRGEDAIRLGGKTYRLRPSHTALRAIETRVRPLLVLVRLGNSGDLSMDQLGIIAQELIRAGADADDVMTRAVSSEGLSALIQETGVASVIPRLTLMLLDAATGGRDAEGNVKAATA